MANAFATIRKVLGSWPRSAQERLEFAMELSREGLHLEAIEKLDEAMDRARADGDGQLSDSQGYSLLLARSEEHAAMRQFDKAIADLDDIQRRYGDDFGNIDEWRAEVMIELGEFSTALELIQRDVAPDDLTEDELLIVARCLAGLGRLEEAHIAFDLAIEKSTAQWGDAEEVFYFHRGKFLLSCEDFAGALDDLEQSLAVHDMSPSREDQLQRIEAHRLCAEAHRRSGDSASAEAATRRANDLERERDALAGASVESVLRGIRNVAASEVAGTMISVSVVIWILGRTVYEIIQKFIPLPPLPDWWHVFPAALLAGSIGALVLIVRSGHSPTRSESVVE